MTRQDAKAAKKSNNQTADERRWTSIGSRPEIGRINGIYRIKTGASMMIGG
jgi:hypothetical protein